MSPSRAPVLLLPFLAACTESQTGVGDTGPAPVSTPTIEKLVPIPAGIHGMAMDDEGVLYLSDTFETVDETSQVYRLAPPYDNVASTGITGPQLSGLLWRDGDLLVTSASRGGIQTAKGASGDSTTYVHTQAAWNIVRADDDSLFVVNQQEFVQKVQGEEVSYVLHNLQAPFDAVIDPDEPDTLWVSEQFTTDPDGRVGLWSTDGTLLRWLAYTWTNPEGLKIDTEGNLWVAETGEGVLLRFDRTTGKLISRHDVPGMPVVISEDPRNGDLLVSVTGEEPGVWVVRLD